MNPKPVWAISPSANRGFRASHRARSGRGPAGFNPAIAGALRDWRGLLIIGLILALTIFAYGAMA